MLRRLGVAAGVLAAVGGVAYWANKQPVTPEKKEGAETTAPKVLELRTEDLQRVELKRKAAEDTVLERQGKEWRITGPKPAKADQDAVSTLLVSFSPLNSDRLVEENAADLGQYGLASPALDVKLGGKNNQTQEVLIGDNTPTNSGFFVKLANDPRVFIISSFAKTSFDKTSKDLQDKRLLSFDPEKLKSLELTAHRQTVEFGRNPQNEWRLVKPKPARADGGQVEGLISRLRDARMEQVPSEEELRKTGAAFSSATPIATVKVTDTNGAQQMDVRKKGDQYYAKSSIAEGAYKIAKDLGDAIDKPGADYRARKLFDFGFIDPDRIDIQSGGKTYSFQKSGERWTSGGKTMDTVSVQNVIDKMRDLTAARFPDNGFTASAVDLTVVSGNGKRTEKAHVAQAGQRYIARREDDATLYELDAKAIPDLLQAAGDVREAKAAKK